MTQKEELRILRDLLMKIGVYTIAAWDGGNSEKLGKVLEEIRYGYRYPQINSYEGQEENTEKLRIESLKRLDKL